MLCTLPGLTCQALRAVRSPLGGGTARSQGGRNLEAGGSENGTGKETHGKPGRMKDSDAEVPSCLEGGQNMQGEKRGEGDLLISGKRSVERGVKQNSEMAPRIQGSLISPHH